MASGVATSGRKCFFCGGTPVNKEHWLRKKWQKTYPPDGEALPPRQVEYLTDSEGTRIVSDTGFYDGKPMDETARVVCEPCNWGWMNDLENEAEPHLVKIFDCAPHELVPEATRSVARWAIKTAMVLEQTMSKELRPTIPSDQRERVKSGDLPDEFLVFLYAVVPRTDIFCRTSGRRLGHDREDLSSPGFGIASINFRRSLFTVVHSEVPAMRGLLNEVLINPVLGWNNLLHTGRPRRWPSSSSAPPLLTDRDARGLHGRCLAAIDRELQHLLPPDVS